MQLNVTGPCCYDRCNDDVFNTCLNELRLTYFYELQVGELVTKGHTIEPTVSGETLCYTPYNHDYLSLIDSGVPNRSAFGGAVFGTFMAFAFISGIWLIGPNQQRH